MESVQGKVAFITGGAGYIGLAMVRQLLQNGIKGVAIVDISEDLGEKAIQEINSSFGNKATFIKADITIQDDLDRAFETTIQTFGQLDIVINNAGIINESEWEKVIAVNFNALVAGTFLAMQKYLSKYKSGNEGIIVNTASDLGFISLPTLPVYSASKHAVVGLGQALGGDEFYQKYKTRILTICPAAVNTPLLTVVNENRYWFPEKMVENLEKMKHTLLSPETVAEALVEVIKKGKNGSLWVIEKEQFYQVMVPEPKLMKVDGVV